MARVNIYLPDGLAADIKRLPYELNLSKICSAAIRETIDARDAVRSPDSLLRHLFWSPAESDLTHRYRHLRKILVGKPMGDEDDARATVAYWTAYTIDQMVCANLQLAIAGGAQIWSAVRHLKPRRLRMSISALGFGQVDTRAPHLHANALVTLLSLLYAPHSKPLLVGSPAFRNDWSLDAPVDDMNLRRMIVGSCAPFDPKSAYAEVLGPEITELLVDERVVGEFLGVFLTADGRAIEPYVPGAAVSHISSADLREHAKRNDTLVVLAASGKPKFEIMRRVLEAELCNMLVTDEPTAAALLRRPP
jgi:DNA-binding transcriptional regulator LsrR (DeoR family)